MSDRHSSAVSAFWFRRDLRLDDNAGLSAAFKSGRPVFPVFIFDHQILENLDKTDARVEFIHQRLVKLHANLKTLGSGLNVYHGDPLKIWRELFKQRNITSVHCNEDYEPYALGRDSAVAEIAKARKVDFSVCKDQVIFAKNEVVKDSGEPYRMFTPYARRWKSQLRPTDLLTHGAHSENKNWASDSGSHVPTLNELGFKESGLSFPPAVLSASKLRGYQSTRDLLALAGTSRFGLHLRFGTISVRRLTAVAREFSETFLNELIWREFFQQILYHFPHTVSEPFDVRYTALKWRNNDADFKRWCEGTTGFPVVDAGMRELRTTGFMHNRARMITASFLCKHLLIDWRRGERYFAKHLLDFDLAANVGNWQWVAGTGCDAAPYFRVFNPTLQAKKFDPEGEYVRRWVPELGTSEYPEPMVDHEMARRRALLAYKAALGKGRL